MMVRRLRLPAAILLVVASATAAAQDNVYFGNLHAHSVYSDGSGTPDEAYKAAREAGLDFMALTEHSHKAAEGAGDTRRIHIARDNSLYGGSRPDSLINSANRNTESGEFVAIYGQEYSTISHGNHVNVFDVPEVIDVIDVPSQQFDRLLEWTRTHPDSSGRAALLQLNHPDLADEPDEEYGRDDFPSQAAWVAAMDAQAELIEMFNGPAMARDGGHRSASVQEADYYHYLNLGFHLAPSVGHDNHYRTWGIVTDARVAVIAPELSRAAVLGALRARHAYATSDRNLRLVFRAGAALQGDIVAALPPMQADLPLTLTIGDDDEPDAAYRIDIFTDVPGGQPISRSAPANSFERDGDTAAPMALDGVPFRQAGQYVLVRVTQLSDNPGEEDVAWSAPIWFGGSQAVSAPALAASLTSVRITKVLPDPAGADLQNERIWLRNQTNASINLAGWTIVDLAGNEWRLTGTLAAGQERSFARSGQPLSLNNDGDRLTLRRPDGTVLQTASYGPAQAGQEIAIPD